MKLTRRQWLMYAAAELVISARSPALAAATDKAFDWRAVCRRWMHVLVPDDEIGPGADCPAVWARIERLMADELEEKGRWLEGLAALAPLSPPQSEAQIDRLFDRRTPMGRFLIHFQHFLLDNYYGSVEGWREFGLTAPPQPQGFRLDP